MRFHHRDILNEVAELNVPRPDQLVINHGSAMVVRGIRPEHEDGDIDMAASLENISYMEQALGFVAVRKVVGTTKDGTERSVVVRHDEKRRFDVHRWDFSVLRYNATGRGRIGLEELIENSDQDDATGIWVARPEHILLTKEQTGRPKDIEDISRLIE